MSDVQILLSTSWTYHNWRFEDYRECQAKRTCFQRTQIQRAKQDQLERHMIFESIDLYAERWAKREQDNLKYISKWKEILKELVTDRISGLKGKFRRPNQKILNDLWVKDCLGNSMKNLFLSLQIKLPII